MGECDYCDVCDSAQNWHNVLLQQSAAGAVPLPVPVPAQAQQHGQQPFPFPWPKRTRSNNAFFLLSSLLLRIIYGHCLSVCLCVVGGVLVSVCVCALKIAGHVCGCREDNRDVSWFLSAACVGKRNKKRNQNRNKNKNKNKGCDYTYNKCSKRKFFAGFVMLLLGPCSSSSLCVCWESMLNNNDSSRDNRSDGSQRAGIVSGSWENNQLFLLSLSTNICATCAQEIECATFAYLTQASLATSPPPPSPTHPLRLPHSHPREMQHIVAIAQVDSRPWCCSCSPSAKVE